MPSGKRETERKGNAPVNTGPSPNSDGRANNTVEEVNELVQGSDSFLILYNYTVTQSYLYQRRFYRLTVHNALNTLSFRYLLKSLFKPNASEISCDDLPLRKFAINLHETSNRRKRDTNY
ncbi:hypothetical protein Tsp_10532 [Trichinella spiralis]|uniref:hypothetical protein n=1 Tax=Trichinella spiralis TaxID=6334 RepID=UPI0001EFD576|nr:hypothetical protein Tsp_10532 [Trichinella spiralis]